MPIVEFTLGSQRHSISCEEGEQEKIKMLEKSLNQRLKILSNSFTSANENIIIAIMAIMMEDEIQTLTRKVEKMVVDTGGVTRDDELNLAVAEALESVAAHVESLAQKVESVYN